MVYSQVYPVFEQMGWFNKLFGEAQTLVTLTPEIQGILPGGSITGITFGIILIAIAWVLPKKVLK